jgi:hypothetical protein
MADQILDETIAALQREWDITTRDVVSEEAILKQLADKIVQVLERGPETFFQLMYRLDVSEKKLTAILNEADVANKIARLVYDRQWQKIRARRAFTGKADDTDEELRW